MGSMNDITSLRFSSGAGLVRVPSGSGNSLQRLS